MPTDPRLCLFNFAWGGSGEVKALWVRFFSSLFGSSLSEWASLFRGRTLSRRLLAPVLPAVLLGFIFFGGFSYWLVRHHIVRSVQQVMLSEATSTARALEVFFTQRLTDLDTISETPLLISYNKSLALGLPQETAIYRRELEKYFRMFAQGARVYHDISYLSADGRRVCSLRPPPVSGVSPIPFSMEFLDHMRKGKRFDPPLQNAAEGGPVIKRYAKPVFNQAGDFLGAILVDCDMAAVEDILRSVDVGVSGGAFIEDFDGNRVLGLEQPRSQAIFRGEMPIREADNRWRWRVVVVAPAREYLARPLRNIFLATVFVCVLGTLLLVVLIVARVSHLMEPIHSMVEGTQRFAGGDLTFRFPGLKSRELDVLAASFNRMAETLEIGNRELEQRLRQATALRDMEESVIQREDEETVLRVCLEAVARGFAFDRTGMYWVDPVRKEIVGRCLFGSDAGGFSEIAFKKRRVPLGGDDLLNEVVRQRKAMVIRNPTSDVRLNPVFVAETKPHDFCVVPICGKDRVLGILTADNFQSRRPLTDADGEGLMLYAHSVGLALENALLFQNLSESESKLRTVLENSPEAILGLSREQWIGTWNRGAEKIFGYTGAEALGKPLTILFPKSAGSEFKKLLNLVMEKGSVRDFVLPGQTKDGRLLELSVSWGGQHQDFWMNKEWTLVIRDTTEARRLQQQLIRSEKLSAVGQLISGIAHELNNPLQAVVGYSDILSDDMDERLAGSVGGKILDPKDVLNDLRIITENAMRCQKIIENLLLFVRQGDIEKRPIDLVRVVESSQELLQYKLKKAAHVDVEVNIPKYFPRIKGNFQQVQQVVVNLINNACDAMSTNAGKKQIQISARALSKEWVRIELTDNGPGIPESVRDRLFEPFFTTKPEGRGTGLGLPVCRQIIEDHGGKIGFRTESGSGTTFWLELPASDQPVAPAASPVAALPLVEGKSVLLVDDEPDVLGFLSKVIYAEGSGLEVAASLKEAIIKASAKPFDLVVTDVRLGEGNGFSLYENWSLWTPHPRPTFLFMTGDVLNSSLMTDVETRNLHLLHKPIDLLAFQNAVRRALSSKNPTVS